MKVDDKYRMPPKGALKTIEGGINKGLTEVNPVWRLEALTEIFGTCGEGWRLVIDSTEIERFNTCVVLCVKVHINVNRGGDVWSEDIPGIGCSVLKDGFNENAYKKAVTDAIGQCCKLLLIGTNVYKLGRE